MDADVVVVHQHWFPDRIYRAGGIIPAGLPGTAAWALGVLVGINMIFGGTALIAMGLHARHA